MLTVVMLNWARPQNTLRNIRMYSTYPMVKDVICMNNGAHLERSRLPSNCVLIESSRDLGLFSRFAAASLAQTNAIFHTDDDLGVSEETLERLYKAWRGAPKSCHGLYGRDVSSHYDCTPKFGNVEVVLTRAVICPKLANNCALSSAHLFEDLLGEPNGNGEDIILSFAAMSLSRQPNHAYPWPAIEYPDPPELQSPVAIHQRWPEHYQHRTKVVHRCREVFWSESTD